MLRPLLFLSALIGLAAGEQYIDSNSKIDIGRCPIEFYGVRYTEIYVSFDHGFAVCFTDYYDPTSTAPNDCVVGPFMTSVYFEDFSDTYYDSVYKDALSSLTEPYGCEVELYGEDDDENSIYYTFGNFTSQSALWLLSDLPETPITVFVASEEVESVSAEEHFIDTTRCRQDGVLYVRGSQVDPDTCSTTTCSSTNTISVVPCVNLNRCARNQGCLLDPICTVTGPTVIDFYGQKNSVSYRCQHTLLGGTSIPGLSVTGKFKERRRNDVYFLDSVTLTFADSGSIITLQQGGVVLVDGNEESITNTPQTFQSVEVSKDKAGVTAKVSINGYDIYVFFDGYTAQIQLTGDDEKNPDLLGACTSSDNLHLIISDTDESCYDSYSEPEDSSIDPTVVAARCNLLNEGHFTACHSSVDPEPYITACIDTLHVYPMVDGLSCQFLEAYARACSLHSNNTLGDWRTAAGCSPHQAFCQDKSCSSHEFCGEGLNDETACLCRAIFAEPYRSANTLGDPTVCGDSASVTLFNCLLEEKNVDSSVLHLIDPGCSGVMNDLDHTVTFSFDSSDTCGAVITSNATHLLYKNTIMDMDSDSAITRHDQVSIDFSCFFDQPEETVMSFRVKDSSVVQHITSESWDYNVSMRVYTDADLTEVLDSDSEVQLNQKIYLVLETDGLDSSLVTVVTDSCWATSQPSADSTPRYYLISNGCPNSDDDTVQVLENGQGTSSILSFNIFQFTGNTGDVYLHCKLELCPSNEEGCLPTCPNTNRRRRDARHNYLDGAPALMTMAWTQ